MGKGTENNATKNNAETTLPKTIGGRIRSLRDERGMTQEQLAEKIDSNCSSNTVYRYENDLVEIKTSRIIRLCEIFGVTPNYLLYGEDARENDMIVLIKLLNEENKSALKLVALGLLAHQKMQENLT